MFSQEKQLRKNTIPQGKTLHNDLKVSTLNLVSSFY